MTRSPGSPTEANVGEAPRPVGAVLETRFLKRAEVSAVPTLVDTLATLIDAHGTLYDWAADQPQPRALRGRAPVFVAALPDSRGLVVIRHAWHGGLLAPITGDRFRGTSRAAREFITSATLRAIGIPTTDVLGFATYRAGFGFRRVDVISRFVADAFDLGMIVAGLVPAVGCNEALAATHTLLVRLAAAGVVHPDLNVKNVLLTRGSAGDLTAMMIDVDVVRLHTGLTPADTMHANVARLSRSIRKWRARFGCDITDATVEQFARTALASTSSIRSDD